MSDFAHFLKSFSEISTITKFSDYYQPIQKIDKKSIFPLLYFIFLDQENKKIVFFLLHNLCSWFKF